MVCIEQKYDAGKADELCAAIKKYMVEAAQDGEVRYTKIGSIIASTDGVHDYKNLLLNGEAHNITISNQQLPAIDTEGLAITIGTV